MLKKLFLLTFVLVLFTACGANSETTETITNESNAPALMEGNNTGTQTTPEQTTTQGANFIYLVEARYQETMHFHNGFAPVRYNDVWGFIDTTGREVVRPQFSWVTHFSEEGFSSVQNADGHWGLIDATGQVVIPFEHQSALFFNEGFAPVLLNQYPNFEWGFIDMTGRLLNTASSYSSVNPFINGFAPVLVGDWETGLWSFIDTTGREIIPPTYSFIGSFMSNGLAPVSIGHDWYTRQHGFINTAGEVVIPLVYSQVTHAPNHDLLGVGLVSDDGETWTWGVMNSAGEEILPLRYQSVGLWMDCGHILFQLDGLWGMKDSTGREVIPPVHFSIGVFHNDLAPIWNEDFGQQGFIDRAGNVVISPRFESAGNFNNYGVATFLQGGWEAGTMGLIDREGNVVLDARFNVISSNDDGFFTVRIGDWETGLWGVIDSRGVNVIDVQFHQLWPAIDGIMPFRDENYLWGFIKMN